MEWRFEETTHEGNKVVGIDKKYGFHLDFFSLDEEGSSIEKCIGEAAKVPRDPGSQDRTFLEV